NNFLEASLILNVYTRDYGKVEAVARSARKVKGKLKGHLELFLDTELILAHGKNIDTITSSFTINSFSNLRNNLEVSYGAYYILELVDRMTVEKHQDERIFYLLKRVLLFLDNVANKELSLRGAERRSNPVTTREEFSHGIAVSPCGTPRNDINCLILFFQINLLNLTGFLPELNKCVFCGKPIKSGGNYFNFSMGGVAESECASKDIKSILISDNAIKLFRLFQFKSNDVKEYNLHLKKSFEIIKKLKADRKLVLNSVFLMNKFIEFNIERKIKGVDFLKGV
ncbi:MAG: DNA repair protein RecO, partial [Candidatus Andersenbacteria bacterium]|nr:DNA repair protein RecO [Candidatus Andersenbacteria bacterium]